MFDVKIMVVLMYVVLKLVVLILNCVVMCYVYFVFDGLGLVKLDVLLFDVWLKV